MLGRLGLRAFAAVIAVSIGEPSDAQSTHTFDYFDGTALSLGHGVNLNMLADSKANCIRFSPVRQIAGAQNTNLEMRYVSDMESLDQARGIDVSAKATGWGASVSGSYSRSLASSFTRDSATLVVTAQSDYGPWVLNSEASLDPAANALISSPSEFVERCGQYYVSKEWRGASVSAIIRIDNISSSLKNTISATFGASGKYGVVSGQVRAKFQDEIRRATKTRRVSVEVKSLGGLGIESLSDVVSISLSDENPLDQISAKLGEYLKRFNADTAVPYRYQLRSMTDFGLPSAYVISWRSENIQILKNYIKDYQKVAYGLSQLESLRDGTHPLSNHLGGYKDSLDEDITGAKMVMSRLKELYDNCQSFDTCREERYEINYKIQTIEQKPKVRFRIPNLSDVQVKLVLNSLREDRRFVASQFSPDMGEHWGATISVDGYELVSSQLYFLDDETGMVLGITHPRPPTPDGIWYATSLDAITAVVHPGGANQDIETAIVSWIKSGSPKLHGTYSGELGVRNVNAAGQVFDERIGQLTWTATPSAPMTYAIELDLDGGD